MRLTSTVALVAGLTLGLGAGQVSAQTHHAKQLTEAQARVFAQKLVPGGTIQSAELEKEDGKLIYSFDIKTADGKTEELWLDPVTGALVKRETETAEQEAAEAAQDRAAEGHAADRTDPAVQRAEAAALKRKPGTVVATKIDTEDGAAKYEVRIRDRHNKLWNVDVDQATGRVGEVEHAGGDED